MPNYKVAMTTQTDGLVLFLAGGCVLNITLLEKQHVTSKLLITCCTRAKAKHFTFYVFFLIIRINPDNQKKLYVEYQLDQSSFVS